MSSSCARPVFRMVIFSVFTSSTASRSVVSRAGSSHKESRSAVQKSEATSLALLTSYVNIICNF
jgi:hypothetical protein